MQSSIFPNLIINCVEDSTTLKEVVKYILQNYSTSKPVVFDTETTGLHYDDHIVGISLFFDFENAPNSLWIPVKNEEIHNLNGIELIELIPILEPIFNNYALLGHNLKFDLNIGHKVGLFNLHKVKIYGDSLLCIHLWDVLLEKNLENALKQNFNIEKPTFSNLIGKSWGKIDWLNDTKEHRVTKKVGKGKSATFEEVAIPQLITNENLGAYACEDCFGTFLIYEKFYPLISSDAQVFKIYNEIELPLIRVVASMYESGVSIDSKILENLEHTASNELESIQNKVFDKSECIFNIDSPQQLSEVLFEKMGYTPLKETPKGAASTNKDTLKELAKQDTLKGIENSVAQLLVKYSEVSTLSQNFLSKIPQLVCKDGRLRGSLNPCGTVTGRFSASAPNIQQMPNNENYPVRSSFVAKKGHKLIVFDYSQFEPRLLAHISKDRKLRKIFIDGLDIYQAIADEIKITRKAAKVLVLAVMYGMGAMSIAESLKILEKEGQKFLDNFSSEYAEFTSWKFKTEKTFMASLEARTLLGRKRNLNDPKKRYYERLRTCVNSVIQGSQADLMKLCMVKLYEHLKNTYNLPNSILLQVHDELVLEVPENLVNQISATVKEVAESFYSLSVPLKVDLKILDNWAGMKSELKKPAIPTSPQRNPQQILQESEKKKIGFATLLEVAKSVFIPFSPL